MTKLNKNTQMKKERVKRKSVLYSQNFLRDPELVITLLDMSSIGPDDTVYEIGPGTGIITTQLASRCRKVVAIEKDPDLAFRLRERFAGNLKVEIYQADFLTRPLPQGKYKVFSNPPFNITSGIVRKLTEAKPPPLDTYLFVQEEAARKFTGRPYAPKESLFSILLKPWLEPSIVYHFRRTDFSPIPGINIVLLRLKTRRDPLVQDQNAQLYRDFVTFGFTQWKSSLKESFRDVFTSEQFRRLAKDLGFKESATPTETGFEQWMGLFDYFLKGVIDRKKQVVAGAYEKLRRQQEGLEKIHRTRIKSDWRRCARR